MRKSCPANAGGARLGQAAAMNMKKQAAFIGAAPFEERDARFCGMRTEG